LNSKIISLKQAAEMIPDDAHIVLGGFTAERHPMAFVYEMIRQRKRNLHLYGHSPGGDWDILIGAGCVKHIEFAYEGDEAFQTIGPMMRKRIQSNTIEWEDYSNFGILCRFFGGAIGVPFMPVITQLGSDIIKYDGLSQDARNSDPKIASKKLHVMNCPFTDQATVLVPSITVDFAVIHTQLVSDKGTVRFLGQTYGDIEYALCARKVIVTAEKIVSEDFLRVEPGLNHLPHFKVDHIVHVPFGSHPYAVYKFYDHDLAQIRRYHDSCKSEDTFQQYLSDYIYDVKDFDGYLEKVKIRDIEKEITADTELGYAPNIKRR
jgi:glutaconate CoA-transferase subunit A